MKLIIISILLLIMPLTADAQKKKQKVSHAQGTLFGYWGYNRSAYTKSNIRFQGPGYDITMQGAKAHDNPSPLGAGHYFDLQQITVPQFNARIGYYFKHHWAISFGYDHMKYIFANRNEVLMSGTIDAGVDQTPFNWNGIYNSEPITTDRNYFHYENSDGLNYLRLELTRTDLLMQFGGKGQVGVSSNLGVAVGSILSFNDYTFGGVKSMRTISMSGYGASLHAGLRFEFFKHLFIQTQLDGGFHHQVRVKTRKNDASSFASQKYGYTAFDTVIGFLFYIRPTNSCDSCPVW
ncbi:MAG: hypothetical protein MK066_02075 [Crocinitomicaceae bacterium]|nr:hypothetical protein [Crocinitomicaceae bacterium]